MQLDEAQHPGPDAPVCAEASGSRACLLVRDGVLVVTVYPAVPGMEVSVLVDGIEQVPRGRHRAT